MFPRANIEVRRGTVDEAIAYVCKVDKNPFIRGEKSVQGQRTDLRELIDKNDCLYDLMEADPVRYCMYRNGLRDIYARKEQVNAEEFCLGNYILFVLNLVHPWIVCRLLRLPRLLR